MTKADVGKAFAVFKLAYPTAEVFRAANPGELRRKLDATTTLWATCLSDVEPWAAEKATIELCKTLKFMPSIAEFRQAALIAAKPPIRIVSAVEQWEAIQAKRAAELKAKDERGLPEWERE